MRKNLKVKIDSAITISSVSEIKKINKFIFDNTKFYEHPLIEEPKEDFSLLLNQKVEQNANYFMENLTLNEYQQKAMTTCMPTCNNIAYMSMNLCGEVGELHSKLAKAIRKGKLFIGTSDRDKNGERVMTQTFHNMSEEEVKDIEKECGDVMWQIAGVCSVLGFSLEDVCRQNLEKLQSRQQRGVIDGNGDNR